MKLIARKPCGFGGKKFYIGDEIPAEYVLEPKLQEKMGVLAIVKDEAAAPDPVESAESMEVVIHAKEGDMPLNLTQDGLQAVVDVLTSKAADAKPVIEQMTDGDALIADSRKEIKTAAENRAKAMSAEETDKENPEESAGEQ